MHPATWLTCLAGIAMLMLAGSGQAQTSHHDRLAHLPFPEHLPTTETAQTLLDALLSVFGSYLN